MLISGPCSSWFKLFATWLDCGCSAEVRRTFSIDGVARGCDDELGLGLWLAWRCGSLADCSFPTGDNDSLRFWPRPDLVGSFSSAAGTSAGILGRDRDREALRGSAASFCSLLKSSQSITKKMSCAAIDKALWTSMSVLVCF